MLMAYLLALTMSLCVPDVRVVCAYRPVVVLHGIFASQDSMAGFVQFIQTAHPGTQVLNVDAYDDLVRQLGHSGHIL